MTHIKELPTQLQADNVQLVSLGESLDKENIIVTLTDHSVFKQVRRATARLMIDFGTPCHKNRFATRRII